MLLEIFRTALFQDALVLVPGWSGGTTAGSDFGERRGTHLAGPAQVPFLFH